MNMNWLSIRLQLDTKLVAGLDRKKATDLLDESLYTYKNCHPFSLHLCSLKSFVSCFFLVKNFTESILNVKDYGTKAYEN
jgi:hypothetical protein